MGTTGMHGRVDEGAMALARQLTGVLRRREQMFGRGAVGEVQWEMLLRLFAEGGENGRLCERSLLVGSGIAAAEALRLLDQLVENSLVWRVAGDGHEERRHVHLTKATRSRIIRILGGLGEFADDMRSDFLVSAGRAQAS